MKQRGILAAATIGALIALSAACSAVDVAPAGRGVRSAGGEERAALARDAFGSSTPAEIEESEEAEEVARRLQPDRPRSVAPVIAARPPRTDVMAQCIEDAFAEEPEVGYSYAIVRNGQLARAGAGGFARAPWETDSPAVPMTPTKPMTIASISKPITAVAVMRLMEEFQLDLDDPFYPLIRERFDGIWFNEEGQVVNVPGPGVEGITLRQLLTHTSGLTPRLGCGRLPELLGRGASAPPGTYDYENSNFCLLRQVIELVSGTSYNAYVESRILDPMGITGMSCEREDVAPTLYYNTIGSPGASWGNYTNVCSAFGWYASAMDLARFLAYVRFGEVLTPASTSQMFNECEELPGSDYCLGWMKAAGRYGTYTWHGGDWIRSGCYNPATDTSECPRGFNGTIMRFPFDVDGVILVNTRSGSGPNPRLRSETTILRECFEGSFE